MTPIRLLRMAWAGAIAATTSSFLYLAYAPIPDSRAVGALLTIGAVLVGAATGAALQHGLENSISSQRSTATIIRLPTEAQPVERLTARGA